MTGISTATHNDFNNSSVMPFSLATSFNRFDVATKATSLPDFLDLAPSAESLDSNAALRAFAKPELPEISTFPSCNSTMAGLSLAISCSSNTAHCRSVSTRFSFATLKPNELAMAKTSSILI